MSISLPGLVPYFVLLLTAALPVVVVVVVVVAVSVRSVVSALFPQLISQTALLPKKSSRFINCYLCFTEKLPSTLQFL
jgi:hypothetical protein